jgi:hypothetical protein
VCLVGGYGSGAEPTLVSRMAQPLSRLSFREWLAQPFSCLVGTVWLEWLRPFFLRNDRHTSSFGLSATNQQYFSLRTNQPTVHFSQNKPAPAISHQPNEQAKTTCEGSPGHPKNSFIEWDQILITYRATNGNNYGRLLHARISKTAAC